MGSERAEEPRSDEAVRPRDADAWETVMMYRAGMTVAEIAQRRGRTASSIYNQLRQVNEPRRKAAPRPRAVT